MKIKKYAHKKHFIRTISLWFLVLALALPLVSLAESYKVVTGGGLNLRKEPSLNSSVLGQYPTGTWMTVLETTGDWSKVQVNGKTGYVLSKYLTDSNVNNTLTVRTNTGIGLNVRTAPSLTGDIVTSFKNGSTVTVLSKGNGWYKVQQGDVAGYVASRFLSGNAGSTTKPSGKQGVVKNPGANQVLLLRETASTDARVLGYYRNGTAVTILGESGSFYKVSVGGKTGYMMKKFISVVGSSSGAASTLPKAPFTAKLVNPNGNGIVNFRRAPGLSASTIKAYPIGTEIQVTEVGDVWCKATIDGTEGYVSRYFFQVVK